MQKERNLQPVQTDEISIKWSQKVAWMAMMVPTRLWLGPTRDHKLTDRLLRLVRACCLPLATLLICCDGCAAYPGSIVRAFRDTVPNPSGGRTRLQAWPEIFIGIINTPVRETGRASDARNTARWA